MESLPHEVLVHIFQFLPLSSRKRIRMMSKKLNTACCDMLITSREQFTINAVYQPFMSDVFATLAKSKQSYINLKFCKAPLITNSTFFSLGHVSSSFWLDHGTKVKYLEFSSCEIKPETLAKILMCCPNLNEFCYHRIYRDFDKALELLLDDNMIMKKVTCLSLIHCQSDFGSQYELLPEVFPNIQKLEINVSNDFPKKNTESANSFLNAAWNYALKLSPNLRYLELGYVLHVSDSDIREPSELLALEILTKILAAGKQINTLRIPNSSFLTLDNGFKLLGDLENLTTLSFSAMLFPINDFLVETLDFLPKLRHLEIFGDEEFHWSKNIVSKIVNSSLQTLRLIRTLWNIDYSNPFVVDAYNDTLETLHFDLSLYRIWDSIIIPSIKCFRKLRSLTFNDVSVSSAVLENIRIYQKNVNILALTLKTEKHHACLDSDDVDTDDDDIIDSKLDYNDYVGPHFFSFREFENLEYLDLKIHSYFHKQYSFSDFVLPVLKTLKIIFDLEDLPKGERAYMKQGNVVNLLRAIEKLPCLESFKLFNYPGGIPYEFLLRQAECHKNLQCLCMGNNVEYRSTVVPDDYTASKFTKLSNLFSIRESLRFVSHLGLTVYKNIITQEIVEVFPRDFDLLR